MNISNLKDTCYLNLYYFNYILSEVKFLYNEDHTPHIKCHFIPRVWGFFQIWKDPYFMPLRQHLNKRKGGWLIFHFLKMEIICLILHEEHPYPFVRWNDGLLKMLRKCALNDFILSLRQSRGIISLTRPMIWSEELQEFLPAKAEWTEGVLCSRRSSGLQLTKLKSSVPQVYSWQQKVHPHFFSSSQN